MTSPTRRRDKPIESVTLKIAFRPDKKVRVKIMEAFPSARFHGGNCEVRIDGEEPREVAEKAKVILETVRSVG